MKTIIRLFVVVGVTLWVGGAAIAAETRVIINLSEQRAYLIEKGKLTLIPPIASGKPDGMEYCCETIAEFHRILDGL